MTTTFSCEDVLERVTKLQKGAEGYTRAERKATWEQLMSHPFINRLPAGIAMYDENFVLLDCNRTYAEYIRLYTPYSVERAMGMSHFEYKPGSFETSAPWFRHVRDSGQGETCYDFELQSLMGGRMARSYWDVHLSPITDECGRLAGSVMCCIDVTERRSAQKALLEKEERLEAKRRSIEDMKAALRVLSAIRAEDNVDREQKLLTNLEQTLRPWIEKLKRSRLDSEQKACVDIIESSLLNIASSFAGLMSSKVPNLTPSEIQVAQLVKLGKPSKEIASLLGVCKESVDFHRNNLRRKLGLSNQKINLSTYLCSLSQGLGDKLSAVGSPRA